MTVARSCRFTALILFALIGVASTGHAQDVSTGPSPLTENPTASRWMRGSTSMESSPTQFRVLGIRRTEAGVTIEGLLLDDRGNACPAGTEGGSWRVSSGCRGQALLNDA